MNRRQRELWGRLAEHLAAWSLRLRGYRILAQRYRTPIGEIDLVACRRGCLVFVEVKARRDLAAAWLALGPAQQRRTERAASWFLQRHPAYAQHACRFDLIAVRPWRPPRHLVDAWRPS